MRGFFHALFETLMYQQTGNDAFDEFVFWSSFYMELAAVIGLVLMILLNEPLRKRLRVEDKLIFGECILVIAQNVLDMSLVPLVMIPEKWAMHTFMVALTVNEVLYLAIILQWLICVDYCLHRSVDHIRRRYKHAALPILIIAVLDLIHSLNSFGYIDIDGSLSILGYVLHSMKLIIEIGYIATAIYLVVKYEKERREPRFLRLYAFIIPFVFGALVRFYDASLLGVGVMLTYAAIKRRDRYIDFSTGLYNTGYLDYICKYWEKKNITDVNAIVLFAPEHEGALAGLLQEIRIPDCFIITMGEGKFVILTGKLRKSAIKMTAMTLQEAAAEATPPFEVECQSQALGNGQTMDEFVSAIKDCANGG